MSRLASLIGDTSAEIKSDIAQAKEATDQFVAWLEAQAPSKTAPSGIGVENYDWYLKNVQLVPYTWRQEVALMESELARAYTFLALEEEKNKTFRNRLLLQARPKYTTVQRRSDRVHVLLEGEGDPNRKRLYGCSVA